MDLVKAHIENGTVDKQDGFGRTALMTASSNGQLDMVKKLLEIGANNDLVDNNGLTATMCAARFSDGCLAAAMSIRKWVNKLNDTTQALKSLLKAGADPNVQDTSGKTALMHVIETYGIYQKSYKKSLLKDTEQVLIQRCSLLIDYEADVNAQDTLGLTPLMYAAKYNLRSCCEALTRNNVTIHMDTETDQTAASTEQTLSAERTRAIDKNASPTPCGTKLKVNVHLQDKDGLTALMHAAKNESTDSCRFLLGYSVDIDLPDKNGVTALMYAASQSSDCCKLLIEQGAKLNLQEKHGLTALMFACRENSPKCCELIVNHDTVDLNIQNEDGMTALMFAADSSPSSCKHLLENNADTKLQDHHSLTALMYAVCGQEATSCELLLNHRVDVNAKNREGMTALMLSVKYKSPECCRLLLAHGAEMNFQDHRGMTALIIAAQQNAPKCCALLLKHGADVNVKDNEGKTAVMYAYKDSRECWKALINRSSDATAKEREGNDFLNVVRGYCNVM